MFCYLLALKIRYPQRIFLLRGNEEDKFETQTRGFYNYCLGYYQEDESAWKLYCSVFECLPLAACIDIKVGNPPTPLLNSSKTNIYFLRYFVYIVAWVQMLILCNGYSLLIATMIITTHHPPPPTTHHPPPTTHHRPTTTTGLCHLTSLHQISRCNTQQP